MNAPAKKHSPFLIGFIGCLSVIVAIPFWIEAKNFKPIFAFHFNPYALLTLMGLTALITAIVFLVHRQTSEQDNLWLIGGLVAIVLFGVGELFQRLSIHPSAALFWAQLSGVGVAFSSACFFLFALNYTKPNDRNTFIATLLLMGAAVIAFFHANGDAFFRTELSAIKLYPWGYNNQIGPAFIANALWIFSLYIASLVLIFNFWRRTGDKILKSQSTLFLIAISIPVVGGIVFDSLLPILGIQAFPPLALMFTTLNGVLLVAGVLKYQVFKFSPSILSQNILSTMNEAVIVTDNGLEIKFVNEETGDILQKKPKDTIHLVLSTLFDNAGTPNQFMERLQSSTADQEIAPIEDLTLTINGKKKYLRILTSKIMQGSKSEGYIFVMSDISELKQAYADLEAAKAGVEHTVAVRTHELREAQMKLLETDKIKSEFIMLASHNLRTPLTAIMGYTSMLTNSHLDESQQKMLHNLQTSSDRLSQLVNNLLTISSIEAGDSHLIRKPIKVAEILEQVVHDLHGQVNTNDDKFSTHFAVGEAQILANPDRLRAALANILDNAFKFTDHGQVYFEAGVVGDKVMIKVEDTGVGIKQDELPKLFTKFHRGTDPLQYDYGGEGIGLYLTKLIIEEHEGTIGIKSQEGKGTTVTIILPLFSSGVYTDTQTTHP